MDLTYILPMIYSTRKHKLESSSLSICRKEKSNDFWISFERWNLFLFRTGDSYFALSLLDGFEARAAGSALHFEPQVAWVGGVIQRLLGINQAFFKQAKQVLIEGMHAVGAAFFDEKFHFG